MIDFEKVLFKAKQNGVISIRNQVIDEIPQEIYDAEIISAGVKFYEAFPIKRLEIIESQLKNIDFQKLENLENLEAIILSKNNIQKFESANLPNLKMLDLSFNKLTQIPPMQIFSQLKILILNNNTIKQATITSDTLVDLEMNNCGLQSIELNCLNLIQLQLDQNSLIELDLQYLPRIQKISAQKNLIRFLKNYQNCSDIIELNFQMNRITSSLQNCEFLSEINELVQLKELNLCNNQLKSTPEGIFLSKSLQKVLLNDNQVEIVTIPKIEFWHYSKLVQLDFSCNSLQEIPAEIGLINSLNKLVLSGNPLRKMNKISQETNIMKIKEFLITKLPLNHVYYTKQKQANLDHDNQIISGQLNNPQLALNKNQLVKLNFSCQEFPFSIFQQDIQNVQSVKLEKIINFNQDLMDQFCESLQLYSSLAELIFVGIANVPEVIFAGIPQISKIECSQMKQLQFVQCSGLPKLANLTVKQSQLQDFVVSECEVLKYVDLQQNQLFSIPQCVFELQELEYLDVSQNKIKLVQKNIHILRKLQVLNIGQNAIQQLPNELGLLSPVQEHYLKCTKKFAGMLTSLKLEGNYLTRPSKMIINRGSQAILLNLLQQLDFDLFIEELQL